MSRDDILRLLKKYIDREITEDEENYFLELLEKKEFSAEWEDSIRQIMEDYSSNTTYDADSWEPVIKYILNEEERNFKKKGTRWYKGFWIKTAAAILILLGVGVLCDLNSGNENTHPEIVKTRESAPAILPGGNKAILQLANGKRIVLDSVRQGMVMVQGHVKILKKNSGQLVYKGSKKRRSGLSYNTLTTPRGGQYQVVLPDGSRVWLNAASSIRYPTVFSGKKRQVEVSGEVYFEVAADADHPFIVTVNNMRVKVLGTDFNIMAYQNEPTMNTTLLKGAVEIIKRDRKMRLRADQQARVNKKGEIELVEKVKTKEVVAWKNGLFQFSDDNVAYIMRQVARWYNVDVEYEGGIPDGHITGKIPRNTSLSNVLEIMELSGINFKIENRKVIVLNLKI